MPTRGFLAQADFTPQRLEFIENLLDDLPVKGRIKLQVGQVGGHKFSSCSWGSLLQLGRDFGTGPSLVLCQRHLAAEAQQRVTRRTAIASYLNRRIGTLFVDVECHDQLGLSAHGVVGDHQHIATIQGHGAVIGSFCIVGEDSFKFHGSALFLLCRFVSCQRPAMLSGFWGSAETV